jgi:hypothetical protein
MDSTWLTVGVQDLHTRIRQRLLGLNATSGRVIWESGAHRVLIHAEELQARFLPGWLLTSVELETDQTGRCLLELVFFLGTRKQADGNTAAVRTNAATREATELAEVWGEDLQRVIWDAVLDAIEVSLRSVRRNFPEKSLMLRGFQATTEGLLVDVVAGEI